jgi:hypothetical protein
VPALLPPAELEQGNPLLLPDPQHSMRLRVVRADGHRKHVLLPVCCTCQAGDKATTNRGMKEGPPTHLDAFTDDILQEDWAVH